MKRSWVVVIAIAIMCILAAGATVAWLTASASVNNTFTVGKIAISLTEPAWTDNSKIYPGAVIAKDPTVTVKGGSEDCYVYAMVDNQLGTALSGSVTLNVSPDWTQIRVNGAKTVYRFHATVAMNAADQALTPVFSAVTVSSTVVTEGNINQLSGKTINVQAFAHQSNAITQADADTAALAHFGVS